MWWGMKAEIYMLSFFCCLKKNAVEGNYFRMRAHRSWILDNTKGTNRAVSPVIASPEMFTAAALEHATYR